MATDFVEKPKPVALLVEDQPKALKEKKELLENMGFIPIGASTKDEAIKEFYATPAKDIIITDINLKFGTDDKSGVEVARHIREYSNEIPIIGYSARFEEGDQSIEKKSFNRYYPKGQTGARDLIRFAEEWMKLARNYRKLRVDTLMKELKRMKKQYGLEDSDYNLLRELSPEVFLESTNESGKPSIETLLQAAGYRMRIIEPGFMRPCLDETKCPVRKPIAVWIKNVSDISLVEIFGYPDLYSYSNNEDNAIKELLFLMDGYYRDLKDATDDTLSVELKRMKDYLSSVFG